MDEGTVFWAVLGPLELVAVTAMVWAGR